MKISETIEKLKQLQSEIGDVIFEVRNPAGDYAEIEAVEKVNAGTSKNVDWRVFADS